MSAPEIRPLQVGSSAAKGAEGGADVRPNPAAEAGGRAATTGPRARLGVAVAQRGCSRR